MVEKLTEIKNNYLKKLCTDKVGIIWRNNLTCMSVRGKTSHMQMAIWRVMALRLLIWITNENAMTRQKWQSTLYTVGNFNLTFVQWFGPNKPQEAQQDLYHDEKTYTPKFNTCSYPRPQLWVTVKVSLIRNKIPTLWIPLQKLSLFSRLSHFN